MKTFSKKRFLSWIVNQLIFLYLVCLVTLNLLKFKKANVIFVNSYAFGHSVIETSVFFHEYGHKGVCISVGSRSNRNKYLKFLYKPYILLDFWLPNIKNINIYHALRKVTHDRIESAFKNSKLLEILIMGKVDVISREPLLKNATIKSLVRDYSCTNDEATRIQNEFDKARQIAEGNNTIGSGHYLMQQKSLVTFALPPKIIRINSKFINTAEYFTMKVYNNNLKLCTLVLRKSWKPWSGQGIDSYVQALDYLKSRNYLVNVIGDLDDFYEFRKIHGLKHVFCFADFKLNSKIFQILSIMNSNFCFGDQSGIQPLIHFFDKKNLIINVVPFGQLHYNSIMLPRIWVDKNYEKLSFEEHLNAFLYKIHPSQDIKGRPVFPRYYSPTEVLNVVKDFVETNEDRDNVVGLNPNKFYSQDSNCMMRFSKNSYFSPLLEKDSDWINDS